MLQHGRFTPKRTILLLKQIVIRIVNVWKTTRLKCIQYEVASQIISQLYHYSYSSGDSLTDSHSSLLTPESSPWTSKRRRASTFHEGDTRDESPSPRWRKRGSSFHEARSSDVSSELSSEATENSTFPLPPPCTCPYFGDKQSDKSPPPKPAEVKIIPTTKLSLDVEKPTSSPLKKSLRSRGNKGSSADSSPNNIVVTWEASRRSHRRGKYWKISQFNY